MAQDARNERQLMRQRGAASRDIGDGDFDLDFDAGSRQERQLMRQRGAGNRPIENIEFDFHFKTPSTVGAAARRSRTRSKTPATATRQPANSRTTPVPAQHVTSPLQPLSNSARSLRGRQVSSPEPHRTDVSTATPRPRKRRRLSEISNMTAATRATSVDTLHTSIAEPIIEEELESPGDMSLVQNNDQQLAILSSPLFSPSRPQDTPSNLEKSSRPISSMAANSTAKRRKRKSIGQQSLRKKRKSGSLNGAMPTPPNTQEEHIEVHHPQLTEQPAGRVRRWSASSIAPDPAPSPAISASSRSPVARDDNPALDAGQPKRRKKRKSIAQGKKKRKSADAHTPVTWEVVNSLEHDTDSRSIREDQEELNELSLDLVHDGDSSDHQLAEPNDLPINDRSAGHQSRMSTATTKPRSKDIEQFDDREDEDADETYMPDEVTPEPTPAPGRAKQKRLGHIAARRRTSSTRRKAAAVGVQKRSRKSGIPILTYRSVNTRALPTIAEEAEEAERDTTNIDTETDELALPLPAAFTDRETPNAVDVLAQACREFVDTAISNLKQTAAGTAISRADLTRRTTALQSFRAALDINLFDISQTLDQRLNLEIRLRRSRREKADLQARWLEVRRRRDQVDLRKDQLRRTHWEGEVLARKRFDASEAAFRIENVVAQEAELNVEGTSQGLEVMLRGLAKDVSSQSGDAGGGILQRLRAFNTQLERMQTALAES